MNERSLLPALAVLLGLAGTAHADATEQLGDRVLAAAADGRCASALRMLRTIDDSAPELARQLRDDPHVSACVDGAVQEPAPVHHQRKDATYAVSATVIGALLGPVLIPVGAIAGGFLGHGTGAAVGAGVGALGAALLPSFGPAYAGQWVTAGLGLRLVGAGLATYALGAVVVCAGGSDADTPADGPCGASRLFEMLAGGGIAYLAGTVLDIVQADHRVRVWNAEVVAAPTLVDGAPGLSLAGRF